MENGTTQEPSQQSLAEQRQQDIDRKTSIGRFALKHITSMAITAVSAAIGYFGFKALRNTKLAESVSNIIAKFGKKAGAEIVVKDQQFIKNEIFPFVGAGLGAMAGGVSNGYSHWKKLESEKTGR